MPDLSITKLQTVGPRRSTDVKRPPMEHPLRHAADHPAQQGPGAANEPFSAPPPCFAAPWYEDVDCFAWFRNLGAQTRALRELLGLSQERLAVLSGVSQGSISRFERGAGRSTPAIIVFRVAVALARQCRAHNQTALVEPLVRILDDLETLVPGTVVTDLPVLVRDPQAAQLQILFRDAPPRAREAVLSILRSFSTIAGPKPGPA